MAIPLLGVLGFVLVGANQIQSIMQLYPPLWNAWQKFALASWPNVNPTVAELISLRYREQISQAEYVERCAQAGINEYYSERLYISATNLLTAADYIALWRRGNLSEDQCNTKLRQLQFSDDDIRNAKKATEFVPGVQDVIRFAVRDAYSPEIASKFGQYEDLPTQFLQEAQKVGLPDVNAKQYWAAHWELPSPNQGFEMFQRRIIDEETLHLLLRSLDVMPFWRDKMTRLAYNPITRVDVRRMYSMGVMTEDEVYNAYLDIGYSPENAQRLTAFTTMDTTDEVENAPLSAVKTAYKKGLISLEQFKASLKELNYSDSVTNFWATLVDYEKREDELSDLSKELKAQYNAGIITLDGVQKMLEAVDAPSNYTSYVIASINKKKSEKTKLPSLGDLRDWLKLNMINDQEFITRALKLGYSKEDTEMYLVEIAKQVPVDKVKYLGQAQYAKWYKMGLLTDERYRFVMQEMNMRKEDIDIAILEGKQAIQAEKEIK